MNPNLDRLQPYPFSKLRTLIAGIQPASDKSLINLSVGEPQHPVPDFVADVVAAQISKLNRYPTSRGSDRLREAIAQWILRRNPTLKSIDPATEILPVSGTREALFSFAQATLDQHQSGALVGMPNPFYQIYEGAALMAGCQPRYINCTANTQYAPDFQALTTADWQAMQLLYLCNPHNPTGYTLSLTELTYLIEKAQQHNVILASDECYSEIYLNEHKVPISLLTACESLGLDDFRQCVVFNSLSKRSSLAGLRSGFVAGDARIIAAYSHYRTYHGCTLSPIADAVSTAAWSDETHARHNRERYQAKLIQALNTLQPFTTLPTPQGGFCLWLPTPIDDERFTQQLLETQNVLVLPGQYLARSAYGENPGKHHVRLALVAKASHCASAIERLCTQL
ncbi:MAG: succinyldiaminopimelate transaminase [Gammaproteobacteria bacterium]